MSEEAVDWCPRCGQKCTEERARNHCHEETARVHVRHTGEVTCTIGVPGGERRDVLVDQILVAFQDAGELILLSLDEARVCIDAIIDREQEGDWKSQGEDLRKEIFVGKAGISNLWAEALKDEEIPAALKRAVAFTQTLPERAR